MQKDVDKIIRKRKEIRDAIIAGINDANKYDKPYDKYIAISCHLDMAGYSIVRKPQRS